MRATQEKIPIASVLHVAHADTHNLGMLRVIGVLNYKIECIIKVSPNFLTLTEGPSSGQKVGDSDFAMFYSVGIEETYTRQRFDCCRYTTAFEDGVISHTAQNGLRGTLPGGAAFQTPAVAKKDANTPPLGRCVKPVAQ